MFSNDRGNLPCSSVSSVHPTVSQYTPALLCKPVSPLLAVLFRQQQVVEFDNNVGKVSEFHKVWGYDVNPIHPRPLSLHPGHDGWQVSRAEWEKWKVWEHICILTVVIVNWVSCHLHSKWTFWLASTLDITKCQLSVSLWFLVMAIKLKPLAGWFLVWCLSLDKVSFRSAV